ncbi:hypothetical protein [Metabacillus endolithicus]|uniref:Uncharacterized protein n=1 Tax=Metabacillus endolithicus TaxID=1535204 RepID=A0ABW5BX91_9BACI|nr:hypothetical protein [Metabacillus endolithicus]UPG65322.1 hypothetical protein MVE64_10255 [Metabacillus endolithicus]
MFVTLLLPVVLPYGNPVTFFDPIAGYHRKKEFFDWVQTVQKTYSPYQSVPLLQTNTDDTMIEGEVSPQTNFVPNLA